MSEPTAAPAADVAIWAVLKAQIRRVQRVSGFAAEMADAFRVEFASLWQDAAATAPHARAAAFVARVDQLSILAERYQSEAARCLALSPAAAEARLDALDLDAVLEAGRGLEAAARQLRDEPPKRGAAPAPNVDHQLNVPSLKPAPPPPPTAKRLTSMVQGWLDRLEVAVVPVMALPLPPPASTPDGLRLQTLDAAIVLVVEILDDVSPRLFAMRAALGVVQGRPAVDKLPPGLAALTDRLVEALGRDVDAQRSAAIAVGQWETATGQAERLAQVSLDVHAATPAARKALLDAHDPAKLKGLVLPLTNLALAFRAHPALLALFPAALTRRITGAVPPPGPASGLTLTSGKAVIPPRPVSAPPPTVPPPPPRTTPPPITTSSGAAQPLDAGEQSRRRLRLITDYIKDPTSAAELQDKALLYRIISEEQSYQQEQAGHFRIQLKMMPPPHSDEPAAMRERRAELHLHFERAEKRQGQLFTMLKQVTSKRT